MANETIFGGFEIFQIGRDKKRNFIKAHLNDQLGYTISYNGNGDNVSYEIELSDWDRNEEVLGTWKGNLNIKQYVAGTIILSDTHLPLNLDSFVDYLRENHD